MACVSIPTPELLTDAQNLLTNATNTMALLSGESCNVFNTLGLQDVEEGIQNILGTVGNAMAAVNSAIAQVSQILNSVLDTALSAINQILDTIINSINQIEAFVQNAIGQITGLIDQAIGVLAERAGISEILACAGTVAQIGLLPPGTTAAIDELNSFLSSDTPVGDIANEMIAGAKNQLTNTITNTVDGIISNIGNEINDAQDIIDLNVNALRNFSCVI